MRRDNDFFEHGCLTRIIDNIITLVILAFALKLAVDAIVSVKIPLLIIAILCGLAVIGYRIYKYWRDHHDY